MKYLTLLLLLAAAAAGAPAPPRPNIIFLVCESTDGRTYREGFAPVPLPNVRKLAETGVQFDTHYANVPVCCPSRASFWSGRHGHKIPHKQAGNPSLTVNGAWNNYEGLDPDFSDKIFDVLERNNYTVKISGKTDWSAGGHSLNVRLNAWTMYTEFPYTVNKSSGWYDETICPSTPTVSDNEEVERHQNWEDVRETTSWIAEYVKQKPSQPFFAYQGMTIVHPPYVTNKYWLGKINMSQVTVPEWAPLLDLHPCDFQSTMLKGCAASDATSSSFYSHERRRMVRAVYYAMIAEFDAMVGAYMDTVRTAGIWDTTVFIVCADHGDMNMEHQQFYKMVQYDASSRVPLVISAPWISKQVVTDPTSHVDLFPTITDLAGVPKSHLPGGLDGESLVPYLSGNGTGSHTPYVVSQFHGDNIAMSWYLVTDGHYKYVVFGTGREVPPQLFDLQNDPGENNNLATKGYSALIAAYDMKLRTVVDYPAVSLDVAQYNMDSFKAWQSRQSDWKKAMEASDLRWSKPFNANQTATFAAIESWLGAGPRITPCRESLTWPPGN
eukprot:Sspe_Gene.70221::Locus_41454_Transcript_2_4_Confidence_0.286_Length_1886::g.70221::m.70221/K12376/ARSK; arylsulfatase K